jgi:phosphopantothenoylcysteine synthetase/decarboxylase
MTQIKTLSGKQIVIAVTGSIAAVEAVKLIHALRRKGAKVVVTSHSDLVKLYALSENRTIKNYENTTEYNKTTIYKSS